MTMDTDTVKHTARLVLDWIAALERDQEIDQEMLADLKVEVGYVFELLDGGAGPEHAGMVLDTITSDVRGLAEGW
jgi:hypothetical protein